MLALPSRKEHSVPSLLEASLEGAHSVTCLAWPGFHGEGLKALYPCLSMAYRDPEGLLPTLAGAKAGMALAPRDRVPVSQRSEKGILRQWQYRPLLPSRSELERA